MTRRSSAPSASSATRDVVVIGAGLAGSALAVRLAAGGTDVLVLEKDSLPRDKLCGEFLSPDAIACLLALPEVDVVERLQALAPPPLHRFRLSVPGGAVVERELERPGIGLSRRQLDGALQAAAWSTGASLADDCRVIAVRPRPSVGAPLFEIECLVAGERRHVERARAVVDAAGRSAAFRERTGGRAASHVAFKRHHLPIGPTLPEPFEGTVEIHAFRGGYCGVSEIEEGRVNVCALARADVVRRSGGSADALLAAAARDNEILARRLAGLRGVGERFLSTADVRFGPDGVGEQGERGALQVGDAAAMIAPLAGDGMAIALRSAELAAEHLAPFLAGERDWAQTVRAHARAWRAEHSRRLRIARILQAALVRPRLARILARVAAVAPPLVDACVRSTRDWRRAEEASD